MAFDREGLTLLWSRITTYIAAYVAENGGNVDIADLYNVGVVKPDGDTITIDADGTIHGTDVVPVATESVPGKVMPDGDTITIDVDGTIHGHGKNGFEGLVGRYGYVGNSGYDKSAYILGDESDGAYTFPMVSIIGANVYRSCTSLVSVEFPNCTNIGAYAFHSCNNLEMAAFPKCSFIGSYAFSYCTKLSEAIFPSCRTVGYEAFWNCSMLTGISLPMVSSISGYAFESCVRLTTLDLTGVTFVPSLATTAFNYTPLSTYTTVTGAYGSIVVPSSLYSRFVSATGWSLFSRRMVSA